MIEVYFLSFYWLRGNGLSSDRVHTVMRSHEKLWNLNCIFQAWKSPWIFGKMAEVIEKSWNFIFLVPRFCAVENWKNSPSRRAKICPQKGWVFSISDSVLAHVQSCESALLNFKKLDQKLEVHFF